MFSTLQLNLFAGEEEGGAKTARGVTWLTTLSRLSKDSALNAPFSAFSPPRLIQLNYIFDAAAAAT